MTQEYQEIFAVIPARGGSKRVKRKNLSIIGGKPLVVHSIDAALDSGMFSTVYVNSDDDEILNCARNNGAEPYARPTKLGGDKVFVIDVIKDMIESLKMADDSIIGILLPTCPLRTKTDIQEAYNLFMQNGMRAPVVSVSSYETPVHLALQLDDHNRLKPLFPDDYRRSTRSTDHPDIYKYNEAIVFDTAGQWMLHSNLIGDNPIPYVMPPERSITIDYFYQHAMINLLLT